MQTIDAIAKRKSTRDFDPNRAVPDEVIDIIVKAGCQAPSVEINETPFILQYAKAGKFSMKSTNLLLQL